MLRFFVFLCTIFPVMICCDPSLKGIVFGDVIVDSDELGLSIHQESDRAILDWHNFSIDKGLLVNFILPSNDSAILNKVVGDEVSLIEGSLLSNGRVYLVNPKGIVVAPSGVVNVSSFISSTLHLDEESFIVSKDLHFVGDPGGSIENRGMVIAREGSVVFIARDVKNEGNISALNGVVGMVGGYSDVLLQDISMPEIIVNGPIRGSVEDKGVVNAVQECLFSAGGNVAAFAINHEGVTNAMSICSHEGRIILCASDGDVRINGSLSAVNSDSTGGVVEVHGDSVILEEKASVDVSGVTGGGKANFKSGDTIVLDVNAVVKANSIITGDGGEVHFIGDKVFTHGHVEACAKGSIGCGGLISAEGRNKVLLGDFQTYGALGCLFGKTQVSSSDITIKHSDSKLEGTTISDAYINDYLATQGSLEIFAEDNINVVSKSGHVNIIWTTPNALSLYAGKQIDIKNNAMTMRSMNSSAGWQAINLKANIARFAEGEFDGIYIGSGNTISSDGGNIAFNGVGGTSGKTCRGVCLKSTITTNSGCIIIVGTGGNITSSKGDCRGVLLKGCVIQDNMGMVIISGVGGSSTKTNSACDGLYINSSNIQASSAEVVLDGGGGSGGDCCGVCLKSSTVQNGSQDIIVDGMGGEGHGVCDGVFVKSSTLQCSAADIFLDGIGGDAISHCNGVRLQDSNIQSSSYNVFIHGEGGSGKGSCCGVYSNRGNIDCSNSNIRIVGFGGDGSGNCRGIVLKNANITTETGDIFGFAKAGSTGGKTQDVQFIGSTTVTSTYGSVYLSEEDDS